MPSVKKIWEIRWRSCKTYIYIYIYIFIYLYRISLCILYIAYLLIIAASKLEDATYTPNRSEYILRTSFRTPFRKPFSDCGEDVRGIESRHISGVRKGVRMSVM